MRPCSGPRDATVIVRSGTHRVQKGDAGSRPAETSLDFTGQPVSQHVERAGDLDPGRVTAEYPGFGFHGKVAAVAHHGVDALGFSQSPSEPHVHVFLGMSRRTHSQQKMSC